jgi:hypothetical protein
MFIFSSPGITVKWAEMFYTHEYPGLYPLNSLLYLCNELLYEKKHFKHPVK